MNLVCLLLSVALGVSLTFDYIALDGLIEKDTKITKLEADVRQYAGKVYDMQENMEDQISAVRSEESVEKWNLQSQLEACKKNAPTPRS